MDTSLTPLLPVQQSTNLSPVESIAAAGLAPIQTSPVPSADTLSATDDVVELSSAARLLSAASSTQSAAVAADKQGSFGGVLNAALDFVAAFNNLTDSLGANSLGQAGVSTDIASTDIFGGVFNTSPGLNGTDLLLQALIDTPVNTSSNSSGQEGNSTSLLTGLSNIGISVQTSPLTGTFSLSINAQTLESAFTSNPTGTAGILNQATASFAPIAANLLTQSNDLFLTEQSLAAPSLLPNIFSGQLDLQQAASNPAVSSIVAEANSELQRTLVNEALGDAISTTQATNAANNSIADIAPITRVAAAPVAAASTAGNTTTTASALSPNASSLATTNTASTTTTTATPQENTPVSTGAATTAATDQIQAQNQANTQTLQDTQDQQRTQAAQNAVEVQNAQDTLRTQADQVAQSNRANLDLQNARLIQNTQDIQDAQASQNALALQEAQTAAAISEANSEANNASSPTANANPTNVAPANAGQVQSIATPASTAPAEVTTDTTLRTDLDLNPANAATLAATNTPAAVSDATSTAATTATPAITDIVPTVDPAFAAAIAAYNLRTPANMIMDTRGARDLGNIVVDAVNSVESASAIPPVVLDVHDQVAAAQRNELLRNAVPRPPSQT